nr:Rho guanine nucleotide exchange factor [Ipomoea batatas]
MNRSCQLRAYFAMDTAYPEVPVKLMNHFHAMDRELYSILVFVLERDPKVSVIIIALWIWLEHNNINCAVQKILSSSSIKLINGLADEAVACLRCITDAMYLFSSDASEVSLTQKVLGKKLSLNFFHENRAKALDGIRVIVEDVCVKELGDLLNLAMQQRFGGLRFTGEYEPKEKRKMFATFSKGHPVFKWELWGYFNRMYGDCVESISMQVVKPNEQSLFAVIVFTSSAIVGLVLRGLEKAKFTIKGKHVWMRKFIPKA